MIGRAIVTEIIKFLRKDLGLATAISGLVFGIIICALYIISHAFYFLVFGPTLIVGSVISLLTINQKINSLPVLGDRKVWLISSCIFFALYCLSWWILFFENRSLHFFLIVALSMGITGLSILASTSRFQILLEIIKIFLVSLNLKYSIYIFAGGFPGVDSWTHARMNDLLTQSGSITTLLGKEEYFPLMHIHVAATQLITDTSIKVATNFSVIVPFIILSIFIFLVARHLFCDKVGLLALLVLNTTDYHIYWGAAPQTTTFGFALYCIIIFLLFRQILRKRDITWLALTVVLFTSLILTHAVSSFILLITLFGYIVGLWIINLERGVSIHNPVIYILLFYFTAIVSYWGYFVQYGGDRSIFVQVAENLLDHIQKSFDPIAGASETGKYLVLNISPFIEMYLDKIAIIIILSLTIATCVWWLSQRLTCPTTIIFFIITVLVFVTFVFPFVGLRNIIPGRWFVFIYFFTSIAIGFYLIYIHSLNVNKRVLLLTTVFVLLALSFVSITNSIANPDAPLWLRGDTVTTIYTPAEFMSSKTLSKFGQTLVVDERFAVAFRWHGGETKDIQFRISDTGQDYRINEDSFGEEVIVWRSYMLTRPIHVLIHNTDNGNWYQDNYVAGVTALSTLERTNKIYDISDVSGYTH